MTAARDRLRSVVTDALSGRFFWAWCWLLFLLPRALLLIFIPVQPISDFQWYFNRAVEIASTWSYEESGHPTAFWPIGYPGLLGAIFSVFGPKLLVAQVANLLFEALTVFMTYRFSVLLFRNEPAARLAALMLALYPNNIAYTAVVATEPLYSLLLVSCCYGFLLQKRHASAIAHGGLIGLATLVKTQTAALAALLVVFNIWSGSTRSERRAAFWRGLVAGVAALAVVLPWSLRNYKTFDAPVFVSTNGGISLLMANNPSMKGKWTTDFAPHDPLVKEANFSAADQIAGDRRARAIAIGWIKANPVEFLALMPQKAFRFWIPDGEAEWSYQATTPFYDDYAVWFRGIRLMNQAYYFSAIGLAALAFGALVRSGADRRAYIGFVVAAYFTAISLIFSGQSRYHFPLMPFMFVYASWLIQLRMLGPKSARPATSLPAK